MAGGITQSTKSKSSLPDNIILPNSYFNIIVSFAAALGGFLFGYEIGIVDAILRMDQFGLTYGLKEISLHTGLLIDSDSSADIKGNITLTFLIGAVFGAAIVSWLADYAGRKRSILIGGSFFTLGAAIQSASQEFVSLYTGRVVSGFGIGILSMVVPLYISETAPTHIRGRMVAIQQLMITIGILVASIINSIIFVLCSGEFQWRFALAVQCIPGIILITTMVFMPDSPRWLVNNQRDSEAVTIISKLRASKVQSVIVQSEYSDIKNGIAHENSIGTASWSELTKRGILNRVIIAILLQTFQQWTGINVILYYAGDLFANMGFEDSSTSSIFVIINSLVNVVATLPGMYLIERIGRKRLLIVGGYGMGISHFLVCIFVRLSSENSIFSWFAVLSVYTFIIFFSATWGPVVWCYQAEIFPLRIRAKASSVATVANWTWNAVIAKVSPLFFKSIGLYTYLIFGVAGVCMGTFAMIIPETMGKTLEEMDELFGVRVEKKNSMSV